MQSQAPTGRGEDRAARVSEVMAHWEALLPVGAEGQDEAPRPSPRGSRSLPEGAGEAPLTVLGLDSQ